MKYAFFLVLLFCVSLASGQSAPNMVIYQQAAADYKPHISVNFTGEIHRLKESVGKHFKTNEQTPCKVFASGRLTTFSEIQYPYVWFKPYTIEMKQGTSGSEGTIIRFFVYDSSGHYLIDKTHPNLIKQFCTYLQSSVDQALKTNYSEQPEKFDQLYLYPGLKGQEALSSEFYLYTTGESSQMVNWLMQRFEFFSDSTVKLEVNDSTKMGTITGIHSTVLGYQKSVAVRFGFENLNNGSIRLFFFLIPDDQRDTNDPIRLSDLHYQIRWFLLDQKS